MVSGSDDCIPFYRLSRALRDILLCVVLLHLGAEVISLRHCPSILLILNVLQVVQRNTVSLVCISEQPHTELN